MIISALWPYIRRVPVPDARFDFLCEYHKPVSKVPAFLNVVDIAGLVKGAAEGQGLGNAFLSHISACDAIFHLCRKKNFFQPIRPDQKPKSILVWL